MSEKGIGRIILKTPLVCECCLKIDGIYRKLNPFKKTQTVELPVGKHLFNAGICYNEMPESSQVHSAINWAWETDKAIEIKENDLYITIKRKWHLLKPVTVEVEIKT